jgi:hypothetical protein
MKRVFRLPGGGRRTDRELEDEFRFHLDGRVEELMQSEGLPRDEAEREARRRFGDYEAYRRQAREIDDDMLRRRNRMELFDTIAREVRHSARTLWRSRAFSVINLVTLAGGIGATTAIYTVLDAVVLRPLPYRNADRLVSVLHPATVPGNGESKWGLSSAGYFYFKRENHTLEDLGGYQTGTVTVTPAGARRARRDRPADHGRRRSPRQHEGRGAEPRILAAGVRRGPRYRREDARDERRRLSDHRRGGARTHAPQARPVRVDRRPRRLRRGRLVS